jgi:hypothetical protein
MQRIVKPELLDQLPATDPRAMRSRRDLRRVNAWMGQIAIMARAINARCDGMTRRAFIDLGAGDGTFMLRLARRLTPSWKNCTAVLVDRHDIVGDDVRAGFEAMQWKVETVTADVFDFLGHGQRPAADVMVCNLFLHHFHDEALSRLLAQAALGTTLFVACEPRRGALAHCGSRFLWALGCNDVNRHDAILSVRAGFRGAELSAMWPATGAWELRERAAGLFSHCFVAARRG